MGVTVLGARAIVMHTKIISDITDYRDKNIEGLSSIYNTMW